MRNILYIGIVIIFVSCGPKGGGGGSNQANEQSPINSALTANETKVVDKLAKLGSVNQKQLIRELLLLEEMQEGTMKKLDKYLTIECSMAQGICHIEKKETL